jgi:hypothetical protein
MNYKNIVLSEQAIRSLQGDHWNTTPEDQEEIESALRRFEDDRTLEENQLKPVSENRPQDGYLNMV